MKQDDVDDDENEGEMNFCCQVCQTKGREQKANLNEMIRRRQGCGFGPLLRQK